MILELKSTYYGQIEIEIHSRTRADELLRSDKFLNADKLAFMSLCTDITFWV